MPDAVWRNALMATLSYPTFSWADGDSNHVKGKKVKVVNFYSALRVHASNPLSSLTSAAGRTATACSLQTQAGAAAGQQPQLAVLRSPPFVTYI